MCPDRPSRKSVNIVKDCVLLKEESESLKWMIAPSQSQQRYLCSLLSHA